MSKAKIFIRLFLLAGLIVSLINLVSMKVQIARTEAETEAIISETREQKLRNEENEELLKEENYDDLIRKNASKLGYVDGDEKVYVGVSGKN